MLSWYSHLIKLSACTFDKGKMNPKH